jgi:hypothetical protein
LPRGTRAQPSELRIPALLRLSAKAPPSPCIVYQTCGAIMPALHHSRSIIHYHPPQQPVTHSTLFPRLSMGVEFPLAQMPSKPSLAFGSHTQALAPFGGSAIRPSSYPPNPNVVWRRFLSTCCHCARQKTQNHHHRQDSRVLNVSGVANVGIAAAVALHVLS